jgi:hypothetical protein
MRARLLQTVAFVAVVPALCAADPVSESGRERDKLYAELTKALDRALSAPQTPAPTPGPTMPPAVVPPSPKATAPELPPDGTPASTIKEGVNLFKSNDFDAARRAFAGLNPTELPREDRAFVKYMTACCLRRLGRTQEAETVYREVANSDDDEFHKNCAIWQLSIIKSNRELETQLAELRSRAKTK